jgi:hypothetical protein
MDEEKAPNGQRELAVWPGKKQAESEPHWQIQHQKVNGLTLSREPHK